MAEQDPQAYDELFNAEPANPSRDEIQEWVTLYSGLVDLLRRTRDDTQQFMDRSPPALRKYLDSENVSILNQELENFEERLEYWKGRAAQR